MLARRREKPPLTVVDNYKRWEKLQAEMGQTVLKLMAHPECTLEQLWLVKMQYSERQQQFIEMKQQLRDLFPHYGEGVFGKPYPWNN